VCLNSAFRVQMLRMFLDTTFNSVSTVLSNLFEAFFGAATRCFYYHKILPKTRRTSGGFMIGKWEILLIASENFWQR
jgi:hypothetical protein